MPKFVILGSCRFQPYELLIAPNIPERYEELYKRNHEKCAEIAKKWFYPKIDQADVVIVYAPGGIGKHTKEDIEYAKSKGKTIVMVTEIQ